MHVSFLKTCNFCQVVFTDCQVSTQNIWYVYNYHIWHMIVVAQAHALISQLLIVYY